MADGKIYITISDSRGGSGNGLEPVVTPEKLKEPKENSAAIELSRYLMHRMLNYAEQQSIAFINEAIGSIGDFTGNYVLQSHVNTAKQALNALVSDVSRIGSAAAIGAQYGGGYGAIIAAAAEATRIGFEKTIGQIKYDVKTALKYNAEKYQSEQTKIRLGLSGINNGSRTGGY